MSKFKIYNIQLLPNEDGIDEVGKIGYRRLFSELRDLNASHLKERTQGLFHYGMPGDVYIGPHDFRFPSGIVFGHFVRYTRTDEVTELRTGKTMFKNRTGRTTVTTKKLIPFVFDTERHYLAIDGQHLPKSATFVSALINFLQPVVDDSFPNHTLAINLISRVNALEDIFGRAVGYKVIDVNLAFPNGHVTENLLAELKEAKTQQLTVHASGGIKGRMSSVPEFLKGLLRAASGYGVAKMTYFVPVGKGASKKEIYNSEDTPVTFVVRQSAADTDKSEFFGRVADKLAEIDVQNAVEESDEN